MMYACQAAVDEATAGISQDAEGHGHAARSSTRSLCQFGSCGRCGERFMSRINASQTSFDNQPGELGPYSHAKKQTSVRLAATSVRTSYLGFKLVVNGTGHKLHCLWEQIVQQAHEDAGVISCQLAQVEISQSSQKHLPACRAGKTQSRKVLNSNHKLLQPCLWSQMHDRRTSLPSCVYQATVAL